MAGEILKKRREELGLSIKDMAALLRIKAEYISSIEEDQFEKLPIAVYTIGYIRCYAAYLRVDPEPILSDYAGHLSYPKPAAVLPIASSRKKAPLYQYLILLAMLLLVVLVAFIAMRQDYPGTPAREPSAPVQPAQTVNPQQADQAPPSQPEIPPAAPQAPVALGLPAEATAAAAHRIEITARELTWLQITFSGGGTEEALLRPGMVKNWTIPDKAVLKIGNAGGVTLHLDGKDLGTPGSSGQVMSIALPENREGAKGVGVTEQQ